MFDTVDLNSDGEISESEWMEFWMAVKANGVDETEINEELDNLLGHGSWTNFNIRSMRRPSRND